MQSIKCIDFAFPYKLFGADDLSVYLRDTDDVLTKLTKTTHYTILPTGNSYANGATVTTVATYASGNTITLVRELDYTQSADYEENDNFPAEAQEAALDRNCILTQQLAEKLARALLVPVDEDRDMTLPELDELKGKYLFFDLTYGKPTAVIAVSVDGATVTDFAKTLLDDADIATLRATIGNWPAGEVSVADSGGFFAGSDAEAVLQELGKLFRSRQRALLDNLTLSGGTKTQRVIACNNLTVTANTTVKARTILVLGDLTINGGVTLTLEQLAGNSGDDVLGMPGVGASDAGGGGAFGGKQGAV